MKITTIGAGYVGLVTGACLADMGNEVTCFDVDKKKISTLKKGKLPFYEPDLKEVVKYNLKEKRLSFSSSPGNSIRNSNVIFICVGTPDKPDGSVNMEYIKKASISIGKNLNNYKVIATKSTVPVGTNKKIKEIVKKYSRKDQNFSVVSNPEFLREGNAVSDFYNPDRIILGFEKNDKKAKKIMKRIYRTITRSEKPVLTTDLKSAETIKYAANSFLATKISFINEIANFCEKTGADIEDVAKGIGMDTRIGPKYLRPGLGYGGSCFPKDVRALIEMGEKQGCNFQIISATENVNQTQKLKVLDLLKTEFGNLDNKTISLWGLSFKPNTDDIRNAASITICKKLLEQAPKIKIKAFDPRAGKNFKKIFKDKVEVYKNMYSALENSEALLILTDWDEFKFPDFKKMKKQMGKQIIVDGRNIYNPKDIKKKGFEYLSIGR